MKAKVLIRRKTGVFDPEGKVIEGGLGSLGYSGIESVAVGKLVIIDFDESDASVVEERVSKMCAEFLVNPVIETYELEIVA